MAGQTEFNERVKQIARRAARTPEGRAAAMRRRKGRHLHGTLGFPISAVVGLLAGWGGMVAADVWLRPFWDSAVAAAEAPVAAIAGMDFATWSLGVGPALAVVAVVLLGFTRFWHVTVAATCAVAALYSAPFVVDYWPQIAQAPAPDWMVAAFT